MLYLMPFYIFFVLWMIYLGIKKFRGRVYARLLKISLLVILLIFPITWDEVIGRSYFNYLCNKDGGLHIYTTIGLEGEHWNEDGSPRFYTARGDFDHDYFDGKYEYISFMPDQSFEDVLSISRHSRKLKNTETKEILGEIIVYVYRYGWVINSWQPFSVRGVDCPQIFGSDLKSDLKDNPISKSSDPRSYRKFSSYIFINKDNKEGNK